MSIKITMPATQEGKEAVAKTYWNVASLSAAQKAYIAKAGKMEAILEEINYAFSRAEDKLAQNNPEYTGGKNETQNEAYTDWQKNMQNYLDQFVNEDTSQYLQADDVAKSVIQDAGIANDYIGKSDIQKMESGEMQPNLNTFKEAYGDDQSQGSKALTAYQSALSAWRNKDSTASNSTTVEPTTTTETTTNYVTSSTGGIKATDPNTGKTTYLQSNSPLLSTNGGSYVPVTTDTTTPVSDTTTPAVDTTTSDLAAKQAEANQLLLDSYNAGEITYASYLLYSDAVSSWEPGVEVNFDNVISKFKELSPSTIDPYYADEVTRATDYISKAKDYMTAQRTLETTSEDVTAKENLKSAKSALEASGMTFTGQGRTYLGDESAYAQEGKGTSPIEGLNFNDYFEGLVPQESRLVSESSLSTYQKNLSDLAASAEAQLGTTATSALGLDTVGDTTGSIQQAKESSQATALSGLYGQAIGNEQQGWETNLLS